MKMLKALKSVRLTRVQRTIINILLIILAIAVIDWATGPESLKFKTSDELLDYELKDYGIKKPYDIIADYSFKGEDGYMYDRQVFVKTDIYGEGYYVCVSMTNNGKTWYVDRLTDVHKLNTVENINWFYIGDYFGNNWSYAKFDTTYIRELCGGSGYSKMTVDGSTITIELDFINDYGNAMDGEHLKNFQPELIYFYDIETGKAGLTGIRTLCIEKDMVLSDEQAAEIAELHIKSKEDFMKAAEDNGMTGEKIFEHVYN